MFQMECVMKKTKMRSAFMMVVIVRNQIGLITNFTRKYTSIAFKVVKYPIGLVMVDVMT